MILGMIICLLIGQAAQAESVLPSLTKTIGRAMLSVGAALERYPDQEVMHEDGSETFLYKNISETEFGVFSVYLEKCGARLENYEVDGSVMTARILFNKTYFDLTYDSGQGEIEATYPAGTYDEYLKNARTHYAIAEELLQAGKDEEAIAEISSIPQYENYGPAMALLAKREEKARKGSETEPEPETDVSPEEEGVNVPKTAENQTGDAAKEIADASEKETGSAHTDTAAVSVSQVKASAVVQTPEPQPEPTEEPYILPENADRSIKISQGQSTIHAGKQLKLKAEVTRLKEDAPKNSSLEWTTNNENIAKVNEKGDVTGVGPGKAKITCSLKDRPEIKAFAYVTVVQPVKSIKVQDNNVNLLLGSTDQARSKKISVTVEPQNATVREFIYSSSNEKVVKVDGEGNLQAVGAGKAKITVSSAEEGSKVKAFCNVTVGQAVTSISMQKSLTVNKKQNVSLKAIARPDSATTKKLEYSTSNKNIATVSGNGAVTGVACGKATITARAADGSGVTATCEVTVIQPVTRVSTKERNVVIFQGKEKRWYVSAEPSDATKKTLRFSSDNSYVASIDSDGRITGKHGGKTRVTATSTDGSGKSCVCNVIVEPSVPISLESIGHGIYNYNLLGLTVKNKCSTLTIVDFDFDMNMYDFSGNRVNGGSYSLGKEDRIGPGATRTIKRTVYGSGQAYKTVITITAVRFKDGTRWYIPKDQQETWSFTR